MKIRRSARLWAAAALLLGLAACSGTSATINKSSWQEFRMPGGDFAVAMPETPKPAKDFTAKDGSISRVYAIEAGDFAYTVGYSTSAPKDVPLDRSLDAMRDTLPTRLGGKLRDERRFSIGDSRGMEYVIDVPQQGSAEAYTIRGRVYVRHVGSGKAKTDVLYQTLVTGNPGRDAAASVTRFLDSFHFVGG
jgi:hypothetical protein